MRYHNITKDDMLNGDGLRVVLWVAGCSHGCKNCQNPCTWDPNGGLPFGKAEKKEIFEQLDQDYIDGITFSGGDPLHEANQDDILSLIREIREKYPRKTIWLYSGYELQEIFNINKADLEMIRSGVAIADLKARKEMGTRAEILNLIDTFVDGPFVEGLKDNTEKCKWRGSTNQWIYDVVNHNFIGRKE